MAAACSFVWYFVRKGRRPPDGAGSREFMLAAATGVVQDRDLGSGSGDGRQASVRRPDPGGRTGAYRAAGWRRSYVRSQPAVSDGVRTGHVERCC